MGGEGRERENLKDSGERASWYPRESDILEIIVEREGQGGTGRDREGGGDGGEWDGQSQTRAKGALIDVLRITLFTR
jgi:hypothetical protein